MVKCCPCGNSEIVSTCSFLRALLLRWLCVSVIPWIVVWLVTDLSTVWLAIGGATLALLAADVLWLTYRVRRDERRVAGG